MRLVTPWIFIVITIVGLSGCSSSWQWDERSGISLVSPEVIVPIQYPIDCYSKSFAVVPFVSKNCPPDWMERFAQAYAHSIMHSGLFASVNLISWTGTNVEDALATADLEGKDFLLYGNIDRLLATGGSQPQGMRLEVQLIHIKTGRLVFQVIQEGFSSPGPDLDLYWYTRVGRSGGTVVRIAERLADQFATMLVASQNDARDRFEKTLRGKSVDADYKGMKK